MTGQNNKDQADLLRKRVMEQTDRQQSYEELTTINEIPPLSNEIRSEKGLSEVKPATEHKVTSRLERIASQKGLLLEEGDRLQRKKLPPRSEVHNHKPKKVKVQLKYPLVRLLTVIFLLLVLMIPGYSIWKERSQEVQESNPTTGSLETIELQPSPPVVADPEVEPNESEVITEEEQLSPPQTDSGFEPNQQDQAETSNGSPPTDSEPIIEPTKEPEKMEEKKEVVEEKYVTHVVQDGETLFRISLKYYNSRVGESKIMEANQLKNNGEIYVGQRLKIPLQ